MNAELPPFKNGEQNLESASTIERGLTLLKGLSHIRGEKQHSETHFYIFVAHVLYSDLLPTTLVSTCKRFVKQQRVKRRNQCKDQQLHFLSRGQFCCTGEVI